MKLALNEANALPLSNRASFICTRNGTVTSPTTSLSLLYKQIDTSKPIHWPSMSSPQSLLSINRPLLTLQFRWHLEWFLPNALSESVVVIILSSGGVEGSVMRFPRVREWMTSLISDDSDSSLWGCWGRVLLYEEGRYLPLPLCLCLLLRGTGSCWNVAVYSFGGDRGSSYFLRDEIGILMGVHGTDMVASFEWYWVEDGKNRLMYI
jgi:hypothetical protein